MIYLRRQCLAHGSRLSLETLHIHSRISRFQLPFLIEKELHALHDLASGALTFDAFRPLALAEQQARVAARHEREVELAASSAAFFAKQASDPVLQARRESKKLRDRYGFGFVEPDIYRRVMQILKRVDDGQRLSAEDVAWLSTDAEECWSPELRQAYHRLEAEALTAEWHQTGDPWAAVTASSHWRKAEEPSEALKVTEAVTTKGHLAARCARLFARREAEPCAICGGCLTRLPLARRPSSWPPRTFAPAHCSAPFTSNSETTSLEWNGMSVPPA
jgi:hypothetical protein